LQSKLTNAELRLYISVSSTIASKTTSRIEITESVVELGPLEISSGNEINEPTAEIIRLRLIPEPQFNPRSSQCLFQSGDTLTLEIFYNGKKRFFGVLSLPPELTEDSDKLYLTLDFVGGLRELWTLDETEIATSDIEYVDVEKDLWKLLKHKTQLPITKSSIDISELTANEAIWSAVARPNIELPGYEPSEVDLWDIVSPVYDSSWEVVYAGFGIFVMSYRLASAEWDAVARIIRNGIGWIIEHLEYDVDSNQILGVVAHPECDISKVSASKKAQFTVDI